MSGGPIPAALRRHWDVIVHAAARPKWTMPAEEAWAANVDPVDRVAELRAPDTHVVLVSTAYSVGLTGSVDTADLADYRNTYEWSKAGAERRVRAVIGPATVVRPPLVIGRRSDGGVARFTGMYLFLNALSTSKLPALVADPDAALELVSTTDVADCCLAVADRPLPAVEVVETLGRGRDADTVDHFFDVASDAFAQWRVARGLEPLEWPRMVRPEQWYRFFRPWADKTFSDRQRRIIALLEPFIPYLSKAEPLPVTWSVAPLEDCLTRCVRHWVERNPTLASRSPRLWAAEVTA
jgi:nucleoside-diphosphate-sugar epimerase